MAARALKAEGGQPWNGALRRKVFNSGPKCRQLVVSGAFPRLVTRLIEFTLFRVVRFHIGAIARAVDRVSAQHTAEIHADT